MGVMRIIRWLGRACLICAVFQLLAAFSGIIALELREGSIMAIISGLTAVMGTIFIVIAYQADKRSNTVEAIHFLIVFWVFIAIVGAVPFYALNASPTLLEAFFESVSAFTTTGASRLVVEDLPDVLIFWRALLQFFGGIATATFAVVILAALNLTGFGIHTSSLFTLEEGYLLPRLLGIGQLVASIYLLFAFVAFVVMGFAGTPAFDALCLSLSGIATGGLQTHTGPIANFLNPVSAITLALLCLLGSFNVSILWDVLRQRRKRPLIRLFLHPEHRALLSLIAVLIIVTVFFASFYNVGPAILDAIYFVSSAGYRYDVISLDMVPAPILITLALLGGSALSTAGGIKIVRVLLLFRHLQTDLARLSHPSRVIPIQFRGRIVEDHSFLSVWMYFFGYSICFALGTMAFSVVGLTLPDALAVSASSLANIGPLLDMTLPASGLRYETFTGPQMLIASGLMIMGRVEVLLVLSLIMRSTWER